MKGKKCNNLGDDFFVGSVFHSFYKSASKSGKIQTCVLLDDTVASSEVYKGELLDDANATFT